MSTSTRVVREYEPADEPALRALHDNHDKGLWYAHPDDPVNFKTWVVEEDGRIVAAMTARMTAEAFLMLDKTTGTPLSRFENARSLIDFTREYAHSIGLREVHIGVPARIRRWAQRLLKMDSFFLDERIHLLMAVGSRLGG
ncbi:MAG: hypothetical protein IPP07_28725 [Holophagales bacterium]|nr:hypothetical protein [Holophagales bacterium]